MKLFKLENELPVLSDEARTIKVFNDIIRRDGSKENDKNGRKKEVAIKELAFIYFYCSFDSRFELYDTEQERIEAIATHLGLPEGWEPDDKVRMGINTYIDLCTTESMRLVNRAKQAIKKYEDYLDTVDLTEVNLKTGNPLHDAKKYRENVNGIAEMIENLNKAKKLVEAELEDKFGGTSKKKERSLITNNEFKINLNDAKI